MSNGDTIGQGLKRRGKFVRSLNLSEALRRLLVCAGMQNIHIKFGFHTRKFSAKQFVLDSSPYITSSIGAKHPSQWLWKHYNTLMAICIATRNVQNVQSVERR